METRETNKTRKTNKTYKKRKNKWVATTKKENKIKK